MTTISRDAVIMAPADAVWQVLAHQFDRIGEWCTGIQASQPSTCPASGVTAPVSGRVCQTRIRLAPAVEERIVQYDDPGRTLTYEAVRPPGFLRSARSWWHVEAIDGQRCRVSVRATVQARGVTGWIMYLVLRLQLARTARQFLRDLEHYVLHGSPSPRKQRQLDQRARHRSGTDRSQASGRDPRQDQARTQCYPPRQVCACLGERFELLREEYPVGFGDSELGGTVEGGVRGVSPP